MKVLVECRGLRVKHLTGLENFALVVTRGIAEFVDQVIVDVPGVDKGRYKEFFKDNKNVQVISDPVQRVLQVICDRSRVAHFCMRKARPALRPLRFICYRRRRRWAGKLEADVVFYPFHLNLPQHHIPMVTTIHAILINYDGRHLLNIRNHMEKAAAIVTSWPIPFEVFSQCYNFPRDRLFMIPFMVCQNLKSERSVDIGKFGIKGRFYFYPSIIAPRKNHLNLIRAYRILKDRGVEVPKLVCTGGGDDAHVEEIRRIAEGASVSNEFIFLGNVSTETMVTLFENSTAVISSSISEAGMSAVQEGGAWGKPVICSGIPEARAHADLFGIEVCFFDPQNPYDIAEKVVQFERDIERYRVSSEQAARSIRKADEKYIGRCYSQVLAYAAGKASKPGWAPFLDPRHAIRDEEPE
ncbi:MAG: glycosyltransferase [Desulfobacteraceae bacterium]|nr:glycosyltransferase [Desulfobacteraceae bacterium]